MRPARLAAWLDSYRSGLRGGLQQAVEQGYRLVHAGPRGDAAPGALTRSGRRHLRKHLESIGLVLEGLVLDYPGRGLADPAHADQRVDDLRHTLELCADLGVARAGVSLAGLCDEDAAPLAREMLGVVADLADQFGVLTAIHDSSGSLAAGADRLRGMGCPHLRLGLDTARLVADPEDIASCAELIGAAHLRDVRREGQRVEEVPFGQGQVDFVALLARLAAGASDAALVIRHNGPGGVDALRQGREYIQSVIGCSGAP